MIWKRNNVWTGVVVGIVAPIIAFLVTKYTGFPAQLFPEKPYFLYLIAGAINLLLLRFFYRRSGRQENIAKGIILVTFLGMLLLLYSQKLNV